MWVEALSAHGPKLSNGETGDPLLLGDKVDSTSE